MATLGGHSHRSHGGRSVRPGLGPERPSATGVLAPETPTGPSLRRRPSRVPLVLLMAALRGCLLVPASIRRPGGSASGRRARHAAPSWSAKANDPTFPLLAERSAQARFVARPIPTARTVDANPVGRTGPARSVADEDLGDAGAKVGSTASSPRPPVRWTRWSRATAAAGVGADTGADAPRRFHSPFSPPSASLQPGAPSSSPNLLPRGAVAAGGHRAPQRGTNGRRRVRPQGARGREGPAGGCSSLRAGDADAAPVRIRRLGAGLTGDTSDATWSTWPAHPSVAQPTPPLDDRRPTAPARTTRRAPVRPASAAARPWAGLRLENRRERIRVGVVPRLLLWIVLPASALLVVAWGLGGGASSPPGPEPPAGDQALARLLLPSASPTVAASAIPPPLRAVTWPRRPSGGEASPAAPPASAASPPAASLAPPSFDDAPTAVSLATVTPAATVPPGPCRAPTPDPAAADAPIAVETTAPVNLRTAPSTDCPIVRLLDPGTRALPLGRPVQAAGRRWLPIDVAGTAGWAAADFLRDASP